MARDLKRLLVVNYHFLPVHNVGVKQFADYCRHLPEAGWRPTVLTRDWDAGMAEEDAGWGLSYVPELRGEAGPETRVVTAPYARPRGALLRLHERLVRASGPGAPAARRALLAPLRMGLSAGWPLFGRYPDRFTGWIDGAVEAGARVVREEGVDAILSHCPPETNHLVASRLAKRFGLPWVAYFGDLFNFYVGPGDWHGTPRRRALVRAMHRRWLAPAGRALAVSPRMVRLLEEEYGVPGEVVVVGYDERDFAGAPPPRDDGRLRITHAGSVYPGDQRPEMLFDALDRVIAAEPAAAEELEVVLVGSKCEDRLREMVAGRPCGGVCRILPKVPPAEAVRLQRTSDVLLLLNLTAEQTREGTLSYPSKVFEYFAARRPVLAFPGDGDWVDALVRDTGGGVVADTVDELARTLGGWHAAWRAGDGIPYAPRAERIEAFSRRRQAARIGSALDRVAEARRRQRKFPDR